MEGQLAGKVAVVTGATRGGGRGIAVELGAAGATVYCTGRSVRGQTTGCPETIEETGELVTAHGGTGIPVRVDFTDPAQVKALFERVTAEQNGRLDILVNSVWGGDALTEWGKPFWEHSLEKGLTMLERAMHSHLIANHYATPLMVARRRGVIFEITDGDDLAYRGSLFYDLVKVSVMRLALGMAEDLRAYGVAAIAVTPGFMRSEAVLEHFGVTEASWRDAIRKDPYFEYSETPRYLGRAVASLAADPNVMEKSGRTLATWTLMSEYRFTDVDGSQPNWKAGYAARERLVADLIREAIEKMRGRPESEVVAEVSKLTGANPVAVKRALVEMVKTGTYTLRQ